MTDGSDSAQSGAGLVSPYDALLAAVIGPDEVAVLLDDLLNADPLCHSHDPELFTGPDEEEPQEVRQAREAEATAICAVCPARRECLAYALAIRPETGVWAGRTAEQINALVALAAEVA